MFNSDTPIKSMAEDTLGRKLFCQELGEAILSYKGIDSLVIGLFGNWGSGKTSVINMTLEYINIICKDKSLEEKPVVIKFNPWNYSEQNQLIFQFFEQLAIVLKGNNYSNERIKKIGEKLEIYANLFKPFSFIPTIGPIASLISEIIGSLGNASKAWNDFKEKDLNSTKEELNNLLNNQSQKIIVIIDNIDRLNNIEIRQIFQLVKSLGDFPNTIYLLSFDRHVVTNALNEVQKGSGIEYLEKVIQIPFEIPIISRSRLENFLFTQLDKVIENLPEKEFDESYWANIFHSGLKYFFNNIRDVKRYINSLQFSFGLIKGEVNTVDFFAITAIQVFLPDIYDDIKNNKDIFSGIFDTKVDDKEIEQEKEICDRIIGKTKKIPQEKLKNFLTQLFPRLESIYNKNNYGSTFLDKWRKELRICSPDIFDRYFLLSLTEGDISEKEMKSILSLGNNEKLFSKKLLKLNKNKKIIRFLEKFEDYTPDIPESHIGSIITILMELGDLFPKGDESFFGFSTPMRILRIIYQLLHRFNTDEERFEILKNAIKNANKSLYTIVHEISVQDQQHGKYNFKKSRKPESEWTVNDKQLEELENLACEKIEKWAKNGKLNNHKYLIAILFAWKRWGEQDKVCDFVNNMIKDDVGLINFIVGSLNKVFTYSGYTKKIKWEINLKDIENFVNLSEIEARIRKIYLSSNFKKLNQQKQRALKLFLDAYNGKSKNIVEKKLV